jgi:hypothetical protein
MTDVKKTSTRRAFFLKGGAVLGAGVAATAGAASLVPGGAGASTFGVSGTAEDRRVAGSAEDREAIRRLHLAFVARLEAQGTDAPEKLFCEPGAQGAVQLSAYRQTPSQQNDEMKFSEDGQRATATFHCEVELCTPLQGDCTAAQMARLQGLVASRRWETGRFEASYVKTRGQWEMVSVDYSRG